MDVRVFLGCAVLAAAACSNPEARPSEVPQGPSAAPPTAAVPVVEVITSPEPMGAVNSTLISAGDEVVVVDAQYTKTGATMVADAVEASGKTLTTIFITHAHPDHYFGARVLADRFPDAKVVAVASTVEGMRETAAQKVEQQATRLGDEFPGTPVVIPEVLTGPLTVGGVELRVMDGLQGDSHPVSGVYVPATGTLVASDVAFSGVHAWTADSNAQSRAAWSTQLDELTALDGLQRVVPGHQAQDADQSPAVLGATKAYVERFDAEVDKAADAGALIEAMSTAYPELAGGLFLQIGASVNKPPAL